MVTIAVSVQYLTKPLEVFREIGRVLRPGGGCIVSASQTAASQPKPSASGKAWATTATSSMVGAYFHYSAAFDPPQWHDISPAKGRSDPMYVVQSRTPQA